jgi:two-component sensor histidine kinase
MNHENASTVEQLLNSDDLAEMLKGDRFKDFLDKIPIALLVSSIRPRERIVYVNSQFESLTGKPASALQGKTWDVLKGRSQGGADDLALSAAITAGSEHIGTFSIRCGDAEPVVVEAYSNTIETDDGQPAYRVVALIAVGTLEQPDREAWERSLRDKDFLLRELQHRVKNNLQMITALIRIESRSWPEGVDALKRIAGRIEALQLLYQCLSPDAHSQEVDLGAYLGQLSGAVMRGNAQEGVRLALEVDVYPVSINIAMPAGLVVNELMTNALKHAFPGRESGTITVQSLPGEDGLRKVVVSDDGVGLPEGVVWPQPGKLGALFVQSFKENANAHIEVHSAPGQGMRATLTFEGGAKA